MMNDKNNHKYLIIPDVHQQHDIVDKIIAGQRGNYDKVIFLGDYFDHYDDILKRTVSTAEWLQENLDNSDYIFLRGNHDVSYLYSTNSELYCSGFTHDKARSIFSKLDIFKFREKTSIFKRLNNFIFSHAGISKQFLNVLVKKGEIESFEYSASDIESKINSLIGKIDSLSERGEIHPIYDCGRERGGRAEVGGIIWLDLDQSGPIPNVISVVGHTPVNPSTFALALTKDPEKFSYFPSHKYYPEKDSRLYEHLFANGVVIGIDTHLHTFAIYDDVLIYKIIYDKKIRDNYYDRNVEYIEKVKEYTFEHETSNIRRAE